MADFPLPDQIIDLTDHHDRSGVGSGFMIVLCITLLGLLVTPIVVVSRGSASDAGQTPAAPLFP